MHPVWHHTFRLTLGALLLGGCTVRDASDTPPPAASAVPAAAQASAAPAATTTAAPVTSPPVPQDSEPGVEGSLAGGSGGPPLASGAAATSAPSSATSPAPSAGGSLAPDSVDVGRKARDRLPVAGMRLEVDLAARSLYVYDGVQRVGTHRVAVGSTKWPTRTGEWYVVQVVWNPEWLPPDESWAEQRTPRKPGAPDNPLGRAQLVYDPPRTIHGTNEPASIGKAVSHGSIRLTNADVVQLGRLLMETTGAGKDDAWYQRVQQNRTEKVIVDLPQRVPLRVF